MRKILFLTLLFALSLSFVSCRRSFDLRRLEKQRVLCAANLALREIPVTITAFHCPRSAGGLHDFYSEGDYWWPDPQNPDGPYIRRDGLSNPQNFIAHRLLLMRLSYHVPVMTAAFLLTRDGKYVKAVEKHLRAWFVDPQTKMNPDLLFAQAIKGRTTGRSIGIIDGIHLIEVVQAVRVLERQGQINAELLNAVKTWFRNFLNWLTTHPYGIKERDHGNNHSTCWAAQVAAYALLVGDSTQLHYVRKMFKTVLIPQQMAQDGSFPKELKRTKPYSYSLFNLQAMTVVCALASVNNDLWYFRLPDGRGMEKAVRFMFPYIKDKFRWPYQKDIAYYDKWPVRDFSLLFAGVKYHHNEYLRVWQKLPADPSDYEVLRNYFVRQPLLWQKELYSK